MSNIWHILNIDSLTTYAGFGLEYYLLGNRDKAKPLLTKGIEFCDMIQKGNLAITQELINQSDLDAWEDIQILVKYKSQDELKTIVEEAALVKIDLMRMVNNSNTQSAQPNVLALPCDYMLLQENATYSEEKIRNIQDFFIDAGKSYLSRAYNIMKRREICRNMASHLFLNVVLKEIKDSVLFVLP